MKRKFLHTFISSSNETRILGIGFHIKFQYLMIAFQNGTLTFQLKSATLCDGYKLAQSSLEFVIHISSFNGFIEN